jgi:arginase
MILFFPQYQAGPVPSHIPNGSEALRALWQDAPNFTEVLLLETDPKNRQTEGGIHYRRILKAQMERSVEIVEAARPDFILTTGGDCSGSFAPIAYINEKFSGKIGVVWIDAHADIHVPETSPTGNYHGMIVRNLLGEGNFDLRPRLPLKHYQIAYLGLRDPEPEETEYIVRHGIPHFGPETVMKDNAPLDQVVAHFKAHGVTHLHLHVDCDVLDSKLFPFVDVPEPGGLTLSRLLEILQYLRSQMPVAGCCLTEYAPKTPGEGIEVVKRVYTEGFGLALPD